MNLRRRPAVIAAGLVLTGGVIATATPAAATTSQPASTPMASAPAAVPIAGTGHAVAHSVTVHAAIAAAATAGARATSDAGAAGPLGRDGKPAGGSLPARAAKGVRPAPAASPIQVGGPNRGRSAGTTALVKPAVPAALAAPAGAAPLASSGIGFAGAAEGNSNCSNCPTPYVSAAVSGTQIAETVNLNLNVYDKSGGALCSVGLSDLLGAVTGISEPRIQYDNANHRFSMVISSKPATSTDPPVFYMAASQADDACGAWWIYSIVMSGPQYPSGTWQNYPYLGQDGVSLLSSTNNFSFGNSYLGSAAFAMPKAVAYTGGGFNFNTYSVAFSTAPVTVAGIPIAATTSTYWVASVPGSGYDVYVMPTNPAGAISLVGSTSSPFSPPSRRIRQPGTSQTLDPLDGRISSAAIQDGNFVWFAHGVDDSGFPTIRYGAIDVTSGQVFSALAYHANGSDDFNPSIGLTDTGNGNVDVWLNWAYTRSGSGVPVSDTVGGVQPGAGLPNLVGADLTLVTGSSTSTISTFGAYSSVEVDPVGSTGCAAGLTALTAQEYFTAGGQWTTRLGRTTFC
jgi:hypothetical protein